jgi:hypothetical protein
MSTLPELTHEQLLTVCDRMNEDFQTGGVPLAVIPLKTLLVMQSTLSKQAQAAEVQLTQEVINDSGIYTGAAVGFDSSEVLLPQSVGGSPRPEHVHLARDTNQDILNGAKNGKRLR